MKPMRHRAFLLLPLWLLAATCVAVGQEPILIVSLDSSSVTIPQGGEAIAVLRIENRSVHTADDLEASLVSDGVALRVEPDGIAAIGPFDQATMALRMSADEGLASGSQDGLLEILYTYCIGDLCFQVFEDIPIRLDVVPPSEGPIAPPPPPPVGPLPSEQFHWIALGVGLLVFGAVAALRRRSRRTWPIRTATVLLAIGALAYGVIRGQHDQARAIGAVLCTSCVGIEASQHAEPRLSAAGIDAIMRIDRDIELLVFHAAWCHACPYAERMVEEVARLNPRITYRLADVEEEPDLARESGVVRSGRTVVPAVLRIDTGEVLFGAERLETRLIELLKEGT